MPITNSHCLALAQLSITEGVLDKLSDERDEDRFAKIQ